MTAPHTEPAPHAWALPTDADDDAELASIGIVLNPNRPTGYDAAPADGEVSLDVQIGSVLRQLGRTQLDLARYALTRDAELAQVTARYARITAPLEGREKMLTAIGEHLAGQAHFPGKAKSRATAWGKFGRRVKPERVTVIDAGALLEWALEKAPTLVITTTPAPVHKVPQKVVAEYVRQTGELPPGVEHVAATDEPFVTPDLTALETA
ncbi:MAG: hypothetical protein ABJA80_01950 [bacterium]